MKTMIALTTLLFLPASFADETHSEGMQADPGETRVSKTRACFEELDRLGCGRPEADRVRFPACAREMAERTSADCQALIKKLY